ncbi:acyl-CoA N-acyltransferase [Mycena latifolia]|nr:acyl-CoA N-acyltransferase [Mycena latifolia]
MADAPTLRPATPLDIRALADIYISGLNLSIPGRDLGDKLYDLERDIAPGEPGVSPPGKLWARFQDQFSKEHFWLAEAEGRVAGYITWYDPTWSEESGYKPGEITYVFVHPSFHRRGIATILLNHAKQHVLAGIKELSAVGEVILELRCLEKNLVGLKFYEREGFSRKHGAEEWIERVDEYFALMMLLK